MFGVSHFGAVIALDEIIRILQEEMEKNREKPDVLRVLRKVERKAKELRRSEENA